MRRWLAPVIGMAMVIAACGSEETEAASGSDGPSSPLAEFLGEEDYFSLDEEAGQAAFVAEERERQELIATCMREQGFEYTPVDPEQFFSFDDADDGLEYGSDEWIARYGFGASTQWFSQEEVGPDLVGHDFGDPSDFEPSDDPNASYYATLSLEEQQAYDEALYGADFFESFEVDETVSEEELAEDDQADLYLPGGCEGEAYEDSGGSMQFYSEFSDELDEMYERAFADPRIVAAEQEVADCVVERGLEYTDIEEVTEGFYDEVQALDAEIGWPGDELSEEDFAELSEAELEEIFSQGRVLTDDQLERLADIQAREIEMAVAVDECGGGFEAQAQLFREVIAEYEQQFLDDNADRLAEFEASGS